MKQIIYSILSAFLLTVSACSSEDIVPKEKESNTDAEVQLAVAITKSDATRAEKNESFFKTSFTEKDEIRFVNTQYFSTPDFFEKSSIFSYNEKMSTPDKSIFTQSGEPTITWNSFHLTSFAFTFEAAYYPGNKPFTEVPFNQSTQAYFQSADLLLAHHRTLLDDRYNDIHLKFHHVFCMVKLIIDVPVGAGGLPNDALQWAKLKNIKRGYEIDYSHTIANDGLRTVKGKAPEEANSPTDVQMWEQSKPISNKVQTYIYYAIIPYQEEITDDFIHFNVKVGNTEKTYRFKPEDKGQINLERSKITVLKLKLDKDGGIPVLLSAEIKDWDTASADMTLDEEDSTEADNSEEGGNV